MSEDLFFDVCLKIFMAFMSGSIILVFLTLVKGPRLEDRVVAIDLFSSVVLSSIALYSIDGNHPHYLTAALVLALFAFLGTVIFARFIEKENEVKS